MTKLYSKWICVPLLSAGILGCENNTQTGALVGALGGAAIGGGIGSMSHGRAGEGALIGAAVGAVGGAVVGNQMDKSEARETYAYTTSDVRSARPVADVAVTQEDVITWTSRGVRDDIIIDRIERSGSTFRVTAADENLMRDRGVGESVISAMKATSRR